METLTSTIVGTFVALVSNASLLYASHLAVRRFLKTEASHIRWAAFGLIAVWLITVMATVLLFLRLLNPLAMVLVSGAIAGLAHLRWGVYRDVWGEMLAIYRWFERIGRSRAAMLLVAVGFVFVLQVSQALLQPPLGWDALTYHLMVPGLWAQSGGYTRLLAPDAWGDYSHFPHSAEVLYAWAMAPFQSDLLVNLVSLSSLLLIALAVYALCRELDAGWQEAAWAGALVVLSPPVLYYARTAYVDNQALAAMALGTLFLVRYIRSKKRYDCTLALAGFGLAVGTKVLAIPALLIACAVVLVMIMVAKRTGGPYPSPLPEGEGTRTPTLSRNGIIPGVIVGLLAVAAVSAPWYVRNWIETGNPLYPHGLSLPGVIFQSSAYLRAALAVDPAAWTPDWLVWLNAVNFVPDDVSWTFGPKLLVVLFGGVVGMAAGLRSSRRWQWVIVAALCLTALALFLSDGMKEVRRYWSPASLRLVAFPFALLAVGGAVALSRVSRGKAHVGVLLGCLLIWDLLQAKTGAVSYGTSLILILVAAGLAAGVVAAHEILTHHRETLTPGSLVALGLATLVFGALCLAGLQQFRDGTRYHYFATGLDMPFFPRNLTSGWERVDDPSRPHTIAYVAGWGLSGHNWFTYPLLGRRLQNHLYYASPTKSGKLPSYVPGQGAGEEWDESAWLRRLQEAKVDLVFVQLPAPLELAWIERSPDRFRLLKESPDYVLYELGR